MTDLYTYSLIWLCDVTEDEYHASGVVMATSLSNAMAEIETYYDNILEIIHLAPLGSTIFDLADTDNFSLIKDSLGDELK